MGLFGNPRERRAPRLSKDSSPFALEPRRKCIVIEPLVPKLRDEVFGVACFCQEGGAHLPVVRKSQQRLFWDRVDRGFGCQGLNVQRVWRRRILGAGAGPY